MLEKYRVILCKQNNNKTAIQLVNSFIVSRVDYCDSTLSGIPSYQLDRIPSLLNVAARLIYWTVVMIMFRTSNHGNQLKYVDNYTIISLFWDCGKLHS